MNLFRPNADVSGTVYNLGVQEGDYDDWLFMFDQYKKELIADEKVIFIIIIIIIISKF